MSIKENNEKMLNDEKPTTIDALRNVYVKIVKKTLKMMVIMNLEVLTKNLIMTVMM